MKVRIGGQRVNLLAKDVIGTGGEATVTRWHNQAVKIYHNPETARADKLADFVKLRLAAKLPVEVFAPQELVQDETGANIIGFTMGLVPPGYVPFSQLANRHWRTANNITISQIASLLLKLHASLVQIHATGMVVGDLNDQNELFCGEEIVFVDVDSWQFGNHPCMAIAEAFCDPSLYNLNLSCQPSFLPNNDWYAFAVLAFKSLLAVHPYGGTHPQVKLLPRRAEQRLPVLMPEVIYPKTGLHPNLLSDELAQVFWQIFADGWRGVFPVQTLLDYANNLVVCSVCEIGFPACRQTCPVCTATAVAFVLPNKTLTSIVSYRELIVTRGVIVWWQVVGNKLYCIANEEGTAVLYSQHQHAPATRQELFRYRPGASYALFGNYLVVCLDKTKTDLLLLELPSLKPLTRTNTEVLGGQHAIFGASQRYLYRIASGMLLRGEIGYGQLVERTVMAVSEQQTWFVVAPDDTIFGYMRLFGDYDYFLLTANGQQAVKLPPLDAGESLRDISVSFAANSILVTRLTAKNGQDWLRLAIIDLEGKLITSDTRRANDEIDIHGLAFANNIIIYASNNGLTRENWQAKNQPHHPVIISDTAEYTTPGDSLQPHMGGMLVAHANKIGLIII